MQCLLQTLLTLHSNINSLWCTPTLIASFTSVFSSFTSVNVGKLQYTAVSPLTTGNINPKHRGLRGPRCITKQTCVVTFNNKLIFDWLDGCRHCNQITLSFYCVLHRNQRTFQGFSLRFKDLLKKELIKLVNCKHYFVYSKCHHSLVSSCLHEKELTPRARNCAWYRRHYV